MEFQLKTWSEKDESDLLTVGTTVDRTYLSGVPFPFRERDACWYIRYCREHEGKTGIFRAIHMDGRVIGAISISRLNDLLKKDAQLGCYLIPEYENRGIMTRCLRIMVKAAFGELPIERITAPIMHDNMASRRIVEKNGFKLEGRLRKSVWKNEEFHDLLLYGILRSEA